MILEALRRSEAERRRARQGADEVRWSAAPARERRWGRLWLKVLAAALLLAMLAALAVLWEQRAGTLPDRTDAAPRAAVPRALPVAASDAGALGRELEPAPVDAAQDAQDAPVQPRPAQAPAEAPAPAPAAAPRLPPPAQIDAPPPSDPAPRPEATRLTALPGSARAALPPLRLSMHVFAEDPAQRFAIIDGARRREGDLLAAGLQVESITREGVRLSWQGQLLELHP